MFESCEWIGRRLRVVLCCLCLLALSAGCADDAYKPTPTPTQNNSTNNSTNNTNNNRPKQDMSGADMSGQDMSAQDMSVPYDMQAPTSYYDPALDALGAPAGECKLDVVDARQAGQPRTARQFITSYRLDPAQLVDHKTYREHIHRIIHDQVLPCRVDDAPNVVIWPGSMSLPWLLLGHKATVARGLNDSANALAQMLRQLERASLYYKAKFPEATLAQNLQLALTDSTARVLLDTFGQLADRYDLYISVSANLPKFERVQDPEAIAALGDPDYEGLGYVYAATDAQIKSRTLLFGPDGKLVAERERAYVTPSEVEILALQGARLEAIKPVASPWGRLGVLDGVQAWMPDVQDRLDDLGAQHYLQLAANEGGWVLPPEAQDRLWRPDVFMFSGWSQVQRSPRALDGVASQLTGRLLDATFDGQTQVVTRALGVNAQARFVGQAQEQAPSLFVGPWALPEPFGDPEPLSLEQRRQALRLAAAPLFSGQAPFVQGAWAVDVSTPSEQAVQTHPAGELMSTSALVVVSSAGKIGQRKLKLTISKPQTTPYEELIAAPAGVELVRPQVVITASDEVLIVAEAVALDGSFNKLFWARYDASARKLLEGDLLETRAAWNFQPWLWRVGRRVLLSWVRADGDSNQAVLMQGSLSGAGGVFANATPQPIVPASNVRTARAVRHWGARVAATSDKLAAVWLDFEEGSWRVLTSVSVDGGLSWSPASRLDETPDGAAAYHESPTISVHPDGFVVAWTDKSSLRPHPQIIARKVEVLATGAIKLGPSLAVSEPGWAFRPELIEGPLGASWLGYEAVGPEGWSVQRVLLPVTLDGVLERREHKLEGHAAHFVRLLRGAGQGQVRTIYERVAPSGASTIEAVDQW